MDLIEQISKFKDMVIATSYQDKVTARSVSTIVEGKKIYFQTSNQMEKYYQLTNNPQVALTKGFYQIEGTAKSIGRWVDHPQLLAKYQASHLKSYEAYGTLPEEEVIEVTINLIKCWEYQDDQVYIISYNPITNQTTKVLQSKN